MSPVSDPRRRWRLAAGGLALALAVSSPTLASALEPRYDHRDLKGPSAEFLYGKDIVWRSSSSETTSDRLAVRLAWGFDPTGDGNELFVGATLRVAEPSATNGPDRVPLTFDVRYRACLGTEELKTLVDIGLMATAADRFSIGPLVGLGFMYDFNRNIGLFASGFLAAGAGQSRQVSFGGGLGFQIRYE